MATKPTKKRRPTAADIRQAEDLLTAAGYTLTPGQGGTMITRPGWEHPDTVVTGTGVLYYAHKEGLGVHMSPKGWFCGFVY